MSFRSLITDVNITKNCCNIQQQRTFICPWEKEEILSCHDYIKNSKLHQIYYKQENEQYLEMIFCLKLHPPPPPPYPSFSYDNNGKNNLGHMKEYLYFIWQLNKELQILDLFICGNADVFAALIHNIFQVPQDCLVFSLFTENNGICIIRPSILEKYRQSVAAFLLHNNNQPWDELAKNLVLNIRTLKHQKGKVEFFEKLAKYIVLRRDGFDKL